MIFRRADRDPEFDAEMLPHLRAVLNVALCLNGNRAEAEDLVQETFLRAFRAFNSFARGTSAKAWLFTILRHCHRNRIRDNGRHPEEHLDEENLEAPEPLGEEVDWEQITQHDVESAIALLPLALRTVVVLREMQGLSYKEISALVGVPIGTVMSRLHRGRAALRRALRFRLGSPRRRAAP
jgi:RNA polymerase sigma-70 factor (ECF subfamily)